MYIKPRTRRHTRTRSSQSSPSCGALGPNLFSSHTRGTTEPVITRTNGQHTKGVLLPVNGRGESPLRAESPVAVPDRVVRQSAEGISDEGLGLRD